MTPRLLLFDLDGTLLGPDRTIRPATIEVLTELMRGGVRVGFATGRSPVSVQRYVDQLHPTGPHILFNGCLLWDAEQDRAIAARTLPRADAIALVEATIDLGVHANVYIDRDLFVAHRGELSLASEEKDGVLHTPVDDLTEHVRNSDSAPFKLLCIEPTGRFDPLVDRFRNVIAFECTIVRSEPTYLEVLPPHVNKGAMLVDIEQRYGIDPTSIAAFGDELNDLELLRAAGRAVVMGNANPTLGAHADDVIGRHDSDAIATYLRNLYDL